MEQEMTAQYKKTELPPAYPTQPEHQNPYPAQPQADANSQAAATHPAPYSYPQQSQYPSAPPATTTTTSTVVVTQQPKRARNIQNGSNPYSYLLPLSMINSFCCCFCFGLVAVYYSTKVNSSWAYGDFEEASSYARKAKIWNVVGLVTGILLVGVVIAFYVARIAIAANTTT